MEAGAAQHEARADPVPWWAAEAVAVLVALCVIPLATAAIAARWSRPAEPDVPPHVPLRVSAVPHRLAPVFPPLFPVGSDEHAAIGQILGRPPAPSPVDGPVAIHLLRLCHGPRPPAGGPAAGDELLRSLTGGAARDAAVGSSAAANASPLVRTRHGVRYRPTTAAAMGENHRDVFLATYAGLGVPLSTPVTVADGSPATLADVLRDSVAHFHLGQREIEWTAVAYALYMPAAGQWQNADRETFSRDQLAEELLRREYGGSPCAGTHLLSAMTALLRVDAAVPRLSPPVRAALHRRVKDAVSRARERQRTDGAWTSTWNAATGAEIAALPTDESECLLVTGHLLESFVFLPYDMQPPKEVYARAANWLMADLGKVQSPATRNDRGRFCPWTHAAYTLARLAGNR